MWVWRLCVCSAGARLDRFPGDAKLRNCVSRGIAFIIIIIIIIIVTRVIIIVIIIVIVFVIIIIII